MNTRFLGRRTCRLGVAAVSFLTGFAGAGVPAQVFHRAANGGAAQ